MAWDRIKLLKNLVNKGKTYLAGMLLGFVDSGIY
jgi:hypothetical protein